MKQFIYRILYAIGKALSLLHIEVIYQIYISSRNRIYTGYLKNRFQEFGDSVIMWKPYHLKGLNHISIGDHTLIEPDLQLTAWSIQGNQPCIDIGNHCMIRRGAHITCTNHISIGNGVLTGTNVFITDNSHGDTTQKSLYIIPDKRPIVSKGPVIIGNNVWLGNNVCILPGVTIGEGVIVGANSVVTHSIPAYTVVAGTPAKIIAQKNNKSLKNSFKISQTKNNESKNNSKLPSPISSNT